MTYNRPAVKLTSTTWRWNTVPYWTVYKVEEEPAQMLITPCQYYRTTGWDRDWKRFVYTERIARGCANYWTVALILHIKSLLKFLERIEPYMERNILNRQNVRKNRDQKIL